MGPTGLAFTLTRILRLHIVYARKTMQTMQLKYVCEGTSTWKQMDPNIGVYFGIAGLCEGTSTWKQSNIGVYFGIAGLCEGTSTWKQPNIGVYFGIAGLCEGTSTWKQPNIGVYFGIAGSGCVDGLEDASGNRPYPRYGQRICSLSEPKAM